MVKKASAVVRLRFPSEEETRIVYDALNPETAASSARRSKVQVTQERRDLTLLFESKDTVALRASINSYLTWLMLLNDVYKTLGFTPKESTKNAAEKPLPPLGGTNAS
jgi:KEOPS complex subunit Pcc1